MARLALDTLVFGSGGMPERQATRCEGRATNRSEAVELQRQRAGFRSGKRHQRPSRTAGGNEAQLSTQQQQADQTRPQRIGGIVADAESLRSHFAELDCVPTDRIFIVRKVQQFGLESAEVIHAHFSAYGGVLNVLVAHSPIMSGCKTYVRRLRPSNMAIVVMGSSAMAETVHKEGVAHCIQGKLVVVERYQRREETLDTTQPAELDVPRCGLASSNAVKWDGDSTADGCSSGTADHSSQDDVDDACISGNFEYWATDDEGLC